MAYLASKGSLSVPDWPTINEFARQYFLNIHPCLPALDEAEFWRISANSASHTISLFVLQALLFSSCPVRTHSCFLAYNLTNSISMFPYKRSKNVDSVIDAKPESYFTIVLRYLAPSIFRPCSMVTNFISYCLISKQKMMHSPKPKALLFSPTTRPLKTPKLAIYG